MKDIVKDFTPEMMEEMSNGLEPGESPLQRVALATALAVVQTVFVTGSSLATVKKISPNHTSGRGGCAIDRLTPHHMAGKLSVESALEWFAKPSTQASATYCIGYDGRIGQGVDEKDRPWTTSSRANDNRAITFEVSNIGGKADGWPISDAAFHSLVKLCVDICQRYGKTKLLYIPDKATALAYQPKADEMLLTKHEWFANTECPGPSLGKMFPELARLVTAELNPKEDEEDMVRYKTVKEMPPYYQKDAQVLIERGIIKGRAPDNLDITEDMVRSAIWFGRALGILEV